MSDIVVYWRDLMGVVDMTELKEKVLLIRSMDNEYLKAQSEKVE